MSAIPATYPVNPALERAPSSLTVLGASDAGTLSSERAQTFGGIFQRAEEDAAERQREEEDLSDTGIAASPADVARTQPQEAALSDTGLPATAAASGPSVGSVPALSDVPDQYGQVVPLPSDKVWPGIGNGSLSEPIKDHGSGQETPYIANGAQTPAGQPGVDRHKPLDMQGQAPWPNGYASAPSDSQSQGVAPEASQERHRDMPQGSSAAARAELEEHAKWPISARADLAKLKPLARAEVGLSLPPGMRKWAGLEGAALAAFAGQSDIDPENAAETDRVAVTPQGTRFGSGPSFVTQRDIGSLPLSALVMRSSGQAGLHAQEALSLAPLSSDATVTDLGDAGGMPSGAELSDWRVAPPVGPNQPLNALARHDLAQALAQQIAVAVHAGDGGKPTVDLRLAPEELGRVRLSVSSHEGVVTVSVVAERPETLDLLRRHVEALARGLLDVGYQEARFSFAGQNSGENVAGAPKAQGFAQPDEQGVSPIPPLPTGRPAPAMMGGRINVLI